MATAMMGLRRRVPNGGSSANNNSSPALNGSPSSSKRSRSENNNCPSHDNLNNNNLEPPPKKSRASTAKNVTNACIDKTRSSKSGQKRASTTVVTDYSGSAGGEAVWPGTSAAAMSDYSGITGGQASLCAGSLAIPYMATSMATYVGSATNLASGKSGNAVSYLDISNMTAGSGAAGSGPVQQQQQATGYLKQTSALEANNLPPPFAGVAPNGSAGGVFMPKPDGNNVQSLPSKFPNDSMFNAYQPWVIKTYGDLAKTKTITIKKYARILRTLRGEEVNSAENSKFRFWVKSKGFHIGQPEGYDAKPADRIIGRHAVTNPGLDPPLYVPTQPPHNKVSLFCHIISHIKSKLFFFSLS